MTDTRDLLARITDFIQLTPGSPEAKAKGCICPLVEGADLQPANDCPVHGLDRLAEVLDSEPRS